MKATYFINYDIGNICVSEVRWYLVVFIVCVNEVR